MKHIKVFLKWCFMLTKRLYKKPSFLILLVLIPIVVGIYGVTAQEESGVMTIALAQEATEDSFSEQVAESFLDSSRLILFVQADSVREAEDLVRTQKADAAWIFPADMEQKLMEFVTADNGHEALVRVVVRENTVPVMLANEKLSGTLFKHCARIYYLHYMRQNADYLQDMTDEQILSYFDTAQISDQLFSYHYANGTQIGADDPAASYLLSPVRGLLGVLIVLSGLTTALYYIQDDTSGTFAWLAPSRKPAVELGYLLICVVNVSLVAFLALLLAGILKPTLSELCVTLLFCLCCASFCQMIRTICGSIKVLGAIIPLLAVLMIAVCPVFYDFAALRYIQLLLPPTYYINGIYNPYYIFYMLIYTFLCQLISWAMRKFTVA